MKSESWVEFTEAFAKDKLGPLVESVSAEPFEIDSERCLVTAMYLKDGRARYVHQEVWKAVIGSIEGCDEWINFFRQQIRFDLDGALKAQ